MLFDTADFEWFMVDVQVCNEPGALCEDLAPDHIRPKVRRT